MNLAALKQPKCLVIFAVLLMGLGILGHPRAALADTNVPIGNVAPLPNSADVFDDKTPRGPAQPWLTVSVGTSKGPTGWLKVYVPVGQAATVTVQDGGGWCWTDPNPAGPAGQDQFYPDVTYSLQDLDGNEEAASGVGSYFQSINNLTGGNNCRDLSFPAIPANAGTPSVIYGHEKYRVFFLVAHENNFDCGTQDLSCSIFKEFRIMTSNGLVGFSRTVNAIAGLNTVHPFGVSGITFANITPGVINNPTANWTFDFMFAPRCSENNTGSSLYIFDVDNADPAFSPQYLSADLYADSRDTPGFNFALQQSWTANQLGAPGVNLSQSNLDFATSSHNRYKFYLRQFSYHNIIQFYLPLDQFDAQLDNSSVVSCFNSTCTIDPTAAIANVGQSIRIRVRMNNAGVAPWTGTFGLGQSNPLSGQLYSFDPSTPAPVQPGQTALFDFNITRGSPISQRITYQMEDAGGFFFGSSCSINIQFLGIPIPYLTTGCQELTGIVSDYSNLTTVPTRLAFSDPKNPAAPAINYDISVTNPPGTFDFDPFAVLPQLRPHIPYSVQLYVQTSVHNSNWTAAGSPQAMPQCLSVTCTQIIPDFQPGETKQLTYGVNLQNQTTQTYGAGTYKSIVSTNPGMFAIAPTTPYTINGQAAPGNNDFSQQFTARSDYTGSIQADVFLGNTNIDNYYTNSPPPCKYVLTPATKPYIKAYYGDVSTGGTFERADSSCAAADSNEYVSPNAPGADQFAGGIRTFSDVANGKGSSTEFAAFSQGLIEGAAGDSLGHGFYSNTPNFSDYTGLNFSNQDTLGGKLGGNTPFTSTHCATDYFDNEPTSAANYLPFGSIGAANIDNLTVDKQYFFKPAGSQLTISSALNIPAGRHVTVFVDGDVYITQNIQYAPWSLTASTSTIPYFALIVKGNIDIAPWVTQLDGLYAAQPSYNNVTKQYDNGILSTCSPGGSPATPNGISNQCLGQITFNGSVLARRVMLLRSKGTIALAPGNGVKPDGQAAEIFNYVPEMVLGQPNFKPLNSGAILPGTLQGLFSLPPIF